jgi:hypothetical protein
LAVTGASTLTGPLTANGGITADGGVFTVADTTGNTAVGGTLAVTGAATLSSTLNAQGAISDSNSNLSLNDNVDVSGTLSVRANDNLIFDSTDAGENANDTYVVHDNANNRLRLYVDGVEVARFKQ